MAILRCQQCDRFHDEGDLEGCSQCGKLLCPNCGHTDETGNELICERCDDE